MDRLIKAIKISLELASDKTRLNHRLKLLAQAVMETWLRHGEFSKYVNTTMVKSLSELLAAECVYWLDELTPGSLAYVFFASWKNQLDHWLVEVEDCLSEMRTGKDAARLQDLTELAQSLDQLMARIRRSAENLH